MLIDPAGEKLIGAILVGDAEAYGPLSIYVKGPIPMRHQESPTQLFTILSPLA